MSDEVLEDLTIGNVTVLFGAAHGKYPHGNSLLVRGARGDADDRPVARRRRAQGRAAARRSRLNSHCHEDHIAGNHLFPEVPWQLHEADLSGLHSFAGFLAIYGYDDAVIGAGWEQALVEKFHFTRERRRVRLSRRRRASSSAAACACA